MLNLNENVDYMEEEEMNNNFEGEKQNQNEIYNSNYTVNFFGAGRGYEDWN